MKKLFSMVTVFMLAIALTGCDVGTRIRLLEDELEALQLEKDNLEQDLQGIESLNQDLQDEIDLLEQQIEDLQALLFDNTITVSMTDLDGVNDIEVIGYNDDFDGTLFDLLNENVEVGFTDSVYGKYIYSLGHLVPSYGAFISFYVNGEMSMVGIEQAAFNDGDVFHFGIEWWDDTAEMVYDAIELFLDHQVENYTSETMMDYNVVLGLNVLGLIDDYVTQEEVNTYVNAQDPTSAFSPISAYFKLIMLQEAVGIDPSSNYTALHNIAATGPYGQTAYALLGLDAGTHTIDYTAFQESALTYFDTDTPVSLDLDAGGISLVALSMYRDDEDVQTLVDQFAEYIEVNQLPSGGIMTQDMGWGATENAASMSQAILGLIANGIDPNNERYTIENNTLITRLLEFQAEDGSFYWLETDETTDLGFSTPQAFLTLAAFYTYQNTATAVNPYSFK